MTMTEKQNCGCKGNGTLCNCMPAIATVPCQQWRDVYDRKTALREGTIFPELNLEFFLAETCGNGGCDGK